MKAQMTYIPNAEMPILQITDSSSDYAKALDVILQRKIDRLTTMQAKLKNFRQQISKEEEISRTLRKPTGKI